MRLLAPLCALALSLTACAIGPDDRAANASREGRAFRPFALYWAGKDVDGLPLTAFARVRQASTAAARAAGYAGGFDDPTFVYGSCHAGSDGGCAPPLEITTVRACEDNLARYPTHGPGVGSGPLLRVAGVPAVWSAGHLDLYTGRVTVRIHGGRRLAFRAAGALRPANRAARAAALSGRRLPPPAPGHLEGLIPCP